MLELDLEDSSNIINILLMGETGVGKSTFINSLANYIQSDTFDKATKTKPILVIPTMVTVYDENEMEDVTFSMGTDDNEVQEVGASATQNVKTYIFPVDGKNLILRIIDTPGLGDARGVDQDDANTESILSFLGQLNKINAICLLMKPSNDRNTVLFSYCVRRILSQLHKSAADNVIFLFTNTKGSDYRPGATMPILKKTIEKIATEPPHVKIPANKANVFCLENECFKNLLALSKGIGLAESTIESCKTSWKLSCNEIIRLIDYVQKLPPHNIQETVSINKTKDLILQLSRPIADITQHLHNKIYILETMENESKEKNQTVEERKKKLYVPTIDLEIINLPHSATVCTNCGVETIKVAGINKSSYKSRCHEPCRLGYFGLLTFGVLGHLDILKCSQMKLWGGACKSCDCSYKQHMNIFYDTKIVKKQIIDRKVESEVKSEEQQLKELEAMIEKLREEKNELEEERNTLSECAAKFAFFLQNNAIISSYDHFKDYIKLALEREKNLGRDANMEIITSLNNTLEKHEMLIKMLNQTCSLDDGETVTNESLYKDAQSLFRLKHTGPKIKEIFEAREACIAKATKASFKNIFTEKIPNWFFKRSGK